jgi:AcrR family transcriptional regulator
MTDQKRRYEKKQRAELEERTRRRITESTVELHGTLGPARTSITAVAERAGVRRSTVYRHFPDEASLFTACTAHWMAAHPAPDVAEWGAIEDPEKRLRTALEQLYAYSRGTAQMMENLHRDEATMPLVKQLFSGFRDYISAAGETLLAGWQARGRARQRVRAAIGHSLAFATWRSLTSDQQLTDHQAVDLMCRLAAAAGHGAGKQPAGREQ